MLAIVLEGFGYVPLKCEQQIDAIELVDKNHPGAALVYLGFEAAESICTFIKQHGEPPLMVLLDADAPDPEERALSLGAKCWERVDAPVELILEKLCSLLDA